MISTNCTPRHYGDTIHVIRRRTPASHFYNEVHVTPTCGDALYRQLTTYKIKKYPRHRAEAGAHAGPAGSAWGPGKTQTLQWGNEIVASNESLGEEDKDSDQKKE